MRAIASGKNMVIAGILALAAMGCESGKGSKVEQEATPAPAMVENPSVTVYPVLMVGRPRTEVARVVAQLLERGGLRGTQVAPAAFAPAKDSDFEEQARGFATFAASQPMKTDYALYCVYFGTPKTGVDEVSGVLVDSKGRVVWSDRQKRGDPDFDRLKPSNPMSCTVLLVERLRQPLHLTDPFRKDAPKGPLDEQFRRSSGIPDRAEFEAIKQRRAKLRSAARKATVAVYPALVSEEFDEAGAKELTERINAKGLLSAQTATEPLPFEFTGSMNQQKVLWSAARSIQELVRQRTTTTDYVLVTHYAIRPNGEQAQLVHLFLLDRQGEFVIVDFQNSHHEDFQRIDPRSREDCAELALARLEGYLE